MAASISFARIFGVPSLRPFGRVLVHQPAVSRCMTTSQARHQGPGATLTPELSATVHPPVTHFSEDEVMMRDAVAKFAADQMAPRVRQMDDEGKMDPGLIKALFDAGLMAIEADHSYGGSGSSFVASLLGIEEISKVDPSVAIMVDIANTLILPLMQELGTQEQKEKYMPRLCTDTVASFCLSEQSSGSDAFALKTTAKKDGEHYVLNGEKMWISNAAEAGLFFVMANAAPEQKHRGITCFIVERETEGLSVGKPEAKLGMCASSTCTVTFEDCRVHESQILGQFGHGYKYAIGMLNGGRIGIGAQLVGLAQGCLNYAVPYVKQREQFGTPIWNFQSMQHQIAKAGTQVEAARVLVYNAARLKDAGLPFIKEAAMAKYFASEVACEVSSRAIEWMGGVGFTKATPVEKFYRDSKVGTIYEGTSNIQLSTIAKLMGADYH